MFLRVRCPLYGQCRFDLKFSTAKCYNVHTNAHYVSVSNTTFILYTIVYKLNVVLLTDVGYLFAMYIHFSCSIVQCSVYRLRRDQNCWIGTNETFQTAGRTYSAGLPKEL